MTTDDHHDEDPDAPGPGLYFLGRTTATGITTPDDLVAHLVRGGVPAEQVTQETTVIVTSSGAEWLALIPRRTDGDTIDSWYIHQYRDEQVHETRNGGAVDLVAASFARPIRVNGSRPDAEDSGGSEGSGCGDGAL